MVKNNGWIKLHRQILDWEWYDDPIVFKLFIHLLLTVNLTNKNWHGIPINRGQIITSLYKLTQELTGKQQTKIGVQRIRTALDRLKSTQEITIKTTTKYTIITILNYDSYQTANTVANKQLTNNQQTTNKQLTTTKECKEDKNERNIKQTLVCEEYSFKNKLDFMRTSSDRRMAIIAYYWKAKGFNLENDAQYQSALKRELRPAKDLKGYPNEKIKKTIDWLNENSDFKWTLETVSKYINEDLKTLDNKRLSEDELLNKIINK